MRTFIASDLHFGHCPRGDNAVRQLAEQVTSSGTPDDVLVLAGDHAADDSGIVSCLSLFRDFPGRKLAVAGNHDVWVRPEEDRDSLQRYQGLSRLYRHAGFDSLEEGPVVVGDTAFVGALGWYDYSFGSDLTGLPEGAFSAKTLPGRNGLVWGDAIFVRWPASDQEMTAFQASRLDAHLRMTAAARRRIVVTHHLPTRRLLFRPRWLLTRRLRFANVFLGSDRLGEVIQARADVPTLAVSGHIHWAKTVRQGLVTYAAIGGDYRRKELVTVIGGSFKRTLFSGR